VRHRHPSTLALDQGHHTWHMFLPTDQIVSTRSAFGVIDSWWVFFNAVLVFCFRTKT
jgi:hypothetical protein